MTGHSLSVAFLSQMADLLGYPTHASYITEVHILWDFKFYIYNCNHFKLLQCFIGKYALKWFAFFNDKTVRLFPGLINRHSIEMWGQYRFWIPSLYIPTHELWSILMSNLSTEILLHEEINEILICKCRSLKVIITIVHVANIIQY